jgi:ubiquinone/menaquinone biosynthesis C-methylase UbiE
MEPREYETSFTLEGEHWWFRSKRALVLSLLARYAGPGARGLDVGCGTGGMLQALAGRGTWVGVDAAALALAYCRKRGLGRLTQGSALALPFRSSAFDVCLCLDLLYHQAVDSDAAALAECHRVLKASGLLIVTDSALAWLRSSHDEAVHGARRYTRADLVRRIRAAGFTPLQASYVYCLIFPAVAAFRLARRAAGREPAGSDVFRRPGAATTALLMIQAIERWLLGVVSLPFGSSVLCVARKAGPLQACPPTGACLGRADIQ